MAYIGRVECPSCRNPLDVDARVCPYCHTSTRGAPWRHGFPEANWWTFLGVGTLFVALVGVMASDQYLGTNYMETVLEHLRRAR